MVRNNFVSGWISTKHCFAWIVGNCGCSRNLGTTTSQSENSAAHRQFSHSSFHKQNESWHPHSYGLIKIGFKYLFKISDMAESGTYQGLMECGFWPNFKRQTGPILQVNPTAAWLKTSLLASIWPPTWTQTQMKTYSMWDKISMYGTVW